MKGDIGFPVQCGERGSLSPLIRNAFTSMGLDLLPRSPAPESSEFPRGMIHRESEPCPFEHDGNPIGVLATCCSFRGSTAALYLMALGMGALAVALFEDKSPEQATTFATQLQRAAEEHRRLMRDTLKKAGKSVSPSLEGCTARVQDTGWEFSIDKALREIEACAKWHEKTGKMNCSVKAWF